MSHALPYSSFVSREIPAKCLPNIAGVFNDAKNVLGLMPHPEDAVEPIHGSLDGKPLFDGIVRALS